ncbi:hypothetical protein [Scytonema sp. PCC 10023]|uniref:hypothetical protein n=1 Tax=Scytonema sp. PCC 10023 TaxID=1680591 RepID=UPI0039C71FF4
MEGDLLNVSACALRVRQQRSDRLTQSDGEMNLLCQRRSAIGSSVPAASRREAIALCVQSVCLVTKTP